MVRDPLSHVRERFLMCTAGSFFRVILNAATLAAVGLFGVYVLTQVLGVDDVVKNASIAALLLVPLPVVVLLMRHIPAIPNQKLASPALAQDAAYFFLRLVLRVTFLAILYAGLRQFYDHYLSWLTIESADQLPVWGRLLASILFSDFLNWLHHYLRHKVPLFWSFHTVHHSQQHLNFFSDGRTHLFEYVIAALIIFLPLFAVRIETPTILAWVIVKQWASLIYHSNLRTNYGLLRYVLVTPQSHRVHHSRLPQHRDKNFGTLLSIWDHLFGTQYRKYDEYPETGICDEHFPHEQSMWPDQIIATYWAQFLYPIRKLLQRHQPSSATGRSIDSRGPRSVRS